MACRATVEEIAEILERRRLCKEKWDLQEFLDALKTLYELLIAMGHWPENSVDSPPPEGWSESDLSTTDATRLGFRPEAINVLKHLPYSSGEPTYNDECDIFDSARIPDYRFQTHLELGRYPYGAPSESPSEVDGYIVPIMLRRSRNGISVVLDVSTGTITEWPFMDPLKPQRMEYRVQQHLDGFDDLGDDSFALATRIEPNLYRYLPFSPAATYLHDLGRRSYTLRLLPLITPRYDANCEIDFSQFVEGWRAEYVRRRQESLTQLYLDFHWPDTVEFDRKGVIAAWQSISKNFGREGQHYEQIMVERNAQ